MALSASNLSLVIWLCGQIGDPRVVFSAQPLSQPVLLSLVQQLGYDLESDVMLKFRWLHEGIFPYPLSLSLVTWCEDNRRPPLTRAEFKFDCPVPHLFSVMRVYKTTTSTGSSKRYSRNCDCAHPPPPPSLYSLIFILVIPYVDTKSPNVPVHQIRDIIAQLRSKLEENFAKHADPVNPSSALFKMLYHVVCNFQSHLYATQ